MSLLQQAEKCIVNQTAYAARNAFLSIPRERSPILKAAEAADKRAADGLAISSLDGRLIAIKDNICTKNQPTTCGSNILEGFVSPFAATVVKKLEASGALPCGKTNMDEFGMGTHSTNSAFGKVRGRIDQAKHELSAGGSSGGSAVAVATGQCWAALGTDTGGSSRLPASYCGVVGFKPSYGEVSRHGVVAYANSLDTVGILATDSRIVREVFNVIRGYDRKDPTSLSAASRSRIASRLKSSTQRKSLRIGVPIEFNTTELEPVVRDVWMRTLHQLQSQGHSIHSISLPATKLALPAYYIIAPAEASSNLARYDGVRYGHPSLSDRTSDSVLYAGTRGEGLGPEARRRILLGSYTLSATAVDNYFIQAQKVRRLVRNDFDRVFSLQHPLQRAQAWNDEGRVDILLSPTAPSLAPSLESLVGRSAVDTYRDDVMTVSASLAGLPAISVPLKSIGRDLAETVGLHVMAQYGHDDMVFEAARMLEDLDS